MKKRILSLALVFALCLGLAVPAFAASTFSDVPSTFWAYNEIKEAVNKGITSGYSDGTFKPGSTVTNAHFAAFLARAFYASEVDLSNTRAWYSPYTDVLAAHDLLKGTYAAADLTAYVNQPISRYDMARLMYNVLMDKGVKMPSDSALKTAKNTIKDFLGIPAQYKDSVATCYAMGVLNGQSDGTFGGQNPMNRAQGCVVVCRLLDKIENNSSAETPVAPAEPVEPVEQESPSDFITSPDMLHNPVTKSGTLTNGKPVTEENVMEILEVIKQEYPGGTLYQPVGTWYSSSAIPGGRLHDGCNGWAAMCSDMIFGVGTANWPRVQEDPEYVRPGDIIKYLDENGNVAHYTIATSGIKSGYKGAKSFDTSDSSAGSNIVEWTSCATQSNGYNTYQNCKNVGCDWVVYTRYPD